MRNFHIKSILLGIGIGIVITSLISMIYTAGINTDKSMSTEEIISKAKELGMVDGTSLLGLEQKDTEKQDDNGDIKIAASNDANELKTEEAGQSKDTSGLSEKKGEEVKEAAVITFTVNPGDTSEIVASRLLSKGLISDKKSFIVRLAEKGLSSEINVGDFKITQGSSEDEIIKIITGKK